MPAAAAKHKHQRQPRSFRAKVKKRDGGRSDAAPDHLAFEPEIPEPDLKGERRCKTDEEEGAVCLKTARKFSLMSKLSRTTC